MSHVDLWLARHGEVAEEWSGRLYGDLDVPLSPEGRRQSEQLARRFEGVALSSVVSSGLERAEFAASLLRAPRGLPRRDVRALREMSRGDWAGATRSEIAAREPALWREHLERAGAHGAPGGETPRELADRVLPALDGLASELSSGTVAVVCHRWVVAVVVCRALGLPYERAGTLDLPHAALVHLRWPGNVENRVDGAEDPGGGAGRGGPGAGTAGHAPELVAFGHLGPVAPATGA